MVGNYVCRLKWKPFTMGILCLTYSHGQMFDLLHFGCTFSTLLVRQIKGRGHQPFPNKMKYRWTKVSVGPPIKRVVCWVGYPFLKNWRQILYKYLFDSQPLKRVVCWVGYPFSSVDGHHWLIWSFCPKGDQIGLFCNYHDFSPMEEWYH